MPSLSLGDLSQMFQLRRDMVRVRQDLATATQELSSGRRADVGKSLAGHYSPLVVLDQQISLIAGYQTNAKEAALFTDTAQTGLERLRQVAGDLGTQLIGLEASDIVTVGQVFATEAQGAFEQSVSTLNMNAGGRAVFGGAATDRTPLSPASDMLAELRTLTAGETTAAGVAAALEAWFAPGGGFDAHYNGSANPISDFKVAEGRSIGMPVRADDPVIRDQLKGLAMGSLLEGSAITDSAEKIALTRLAGQAIISNRDRMLALQAQVGSSQARIETGRTQNATETTALTMARNEIVAVDPAEVATELKNLEAQLETIYTVTARLSGLSLTRYLR